MGWRVAARHRPGPDSPRGLRPRPSPVIANPAPPADAGQDRGRGRSRPCDQRDPNCHSASCARCSCAGGDSPSSGPGTGHRHPAGAICHSSPHAGDRHPPTDTPASRPSVRPFWRGGPANGRPHDGGAPDDHPRVTKDSDADGSAPHTAHDRQSLAQRRGRFPTLGGPSKVLRQVGDGLVDGVDKHDALRFPRVHRQVRP